MIWHIDATQIAGIAAIAGLVGYGLHVAVSFFGGWGKLKKQHDQILDEANAKASEALGRLRDALTAELSLRNQQLAENQTRISDLTSRMEDMEKKYQAELTAAHEQNAKLREQIAELKAKNAELYARLEKLEKEREKK